jgi:hypothetical protein
VLVFALVVLLAALFGVCRWSGATLARHHGDGWEVGAVAGLGAAVLSALWLSRALPGIEAGLVTLGLVGAGAGGLFAGYMRREPAE